MMQHLLLALAAYLSLTLLAAAAMGQTSSLWGERGEKWSPSSRLPDFSFAGYRCGEEPIPEVPAVTDATRFGAMPDDDADDADAIQRAIDATERGAVVLPAGRFVLGKTVRMNRSHVVLRGAGEGKTILFVPRSLSQVYGAKEVDVGKVNYSFGGGFIEAQGRDGGEPLGTITQPARRGARTLVLSAEPKVRPGDWVRLTVPGSVEFGRHLHGEQHDPGKDTLARQEYFGNWAARVAEVDGAVVTLDRPLRFDVRAEWSPTLHTLTPTIQEIGIEHLTFEFAGVPKQPHLKEEGFNAIHWRGVHHAWIRNVTFLDADNAVTFGGCRHVTVVNVTIDAPKRKNPSGHHALWATGGTQDCLFSDFRIDTMYEHELTVEGLASGNVFMNGTGEILAFDHHRNAPFENLFTNLHTKSPRRMFASSGRGDRGPHSAARTTFWNVRHDGGRLPKLIGSDHYPLANVIGIAGFPASSDEQGVWVEPIENLVPANLYESQRTKRLGKPGPVQR